MSDGTRCDGCKEMIAKEGEDYLELTLERKDPEDENGRGGYYRTKGTKHFHSRACLQHWVGKVGWWDGAFADLDLRSAVGVSQEHVTGGQS